MPANAITRRQFLKGTPVFAAALALGRTAHSAQVVTVAHLAPGLVDPHSAVREHAGRV